MEITLKKLEFSMAEELASLANDPKIAANLTNQFPHPYTLENAKNFIEMQNNFVPTRVFGIFYNTQLAGAIGVHPQSDIFCKNAELGYWIAQKYWGLGIATSAIKLIVEYGFKEFDINRIFARQFGYNIASQKVLEKNGFELEATLTNTIYKNGQYTDELIFAIRRKD